MTLPGEPTSALPMAAATRQSPTMKSRVDLSPADC